MKDKSINITTSKVTFENSAPLLIFGNYFVVAVLVCSDIEPLRTLIIIGVVIFTSILIRMIQKNGNLKCKANLKKKKYEIIEGLRKEGIDSSLVLLTLDNIGVLMDEKNKKIAICNEINVKPMIFNFEDIESGEIIEDNTNLYILFHTKIKKNNNVQIELIQNGYNKKSYEHNILHNFAKEIITITNIIAKLNKNEIKSE